MQWAASCCQLSLALLLWSSKEGWGTLCKIKVMSGQCVKMKGVFLFLQQVPTEEGFFSPLL